MTPNVFNLHLASGLISILREFHDKQCYVWENYLLLRKTIKTLQLLVKRRFLLIMSLIF